MASYITTETDMSRVTALSTDTKNFVFVPINSTWGPDDEYVELTSTTQLQNVYGGDPEVGEDGLEELTSYQYAAGVLRNGFSVLAKRVVDNTINKKAYAEDAKQEDETYIIPSPFTLPFVKKEGETTKKFYLYVLCRKTSGGKDAIVAKDYGTYANDFVITCSAKFMSASKFGLYFIIKKNGTTLEENLFGSVRLDETGENVEFTPSNPVSSYIEFGDYSFEKMDQDTPSTGLALRWSNAVPQGYVDVSYITLPFANQSENKGLNITRDIAREKVKEGFATQTGSQPSGEFVANVGDKWLYDVKFISNGGYVESETTEKAIAGGMIEIADARQDCVAFIDTPKNCDDATKVEEYVTNLTEKSAYAAVYSPWCKATPYGTNSTVWVPASYLAITSFAKSFASGNSICDVPAGVNRGSVNIITPQFTIGGVTQERWQRGNGEGSDLTFCINPIMNIRKYGYCIFGQRTLLELPYGSTSALQELCVRLTLNEIKRWVRDVALSLTFESNSNRTWNEFVSKTQQCLDKLVAGGYLTNYKIIRSTDNTNQVNTNSLNATIQAYVTRALENFNINVEVFSGEVTFTETTE